MWCAQALACSATPTTSQATPTPVSASNDALVPFERGFTFSRTGDDVVVDEVRGTQGTFVAGDSYHVRGHYKLVSAANATLAVYVTNGHCDEDSNHLVVPRGTGTFDVALDIRTMGYPHVGLYPMPSGKAVATGYFGAGASVFHHEHHEGDGW